MAKNPCDDVDRQVKNYEGLRNVKNRKMSRQANPSSKALKERNFRKRERERKHFEGPLRQFIEVKYQDIFKEYVQLYELMVANHPGKRNLSRSRTFRQWKRANQTSATDILSTVIRETFGQEYEGEREGHEASNAESEGYEGDELAVNVQSEGHGASNAESEGDEAVVNDQSEGHEASNAESEGYEGDEAVVNVQNEGHQTANGENKGNEAANVLEVLDNIEGQVDAIMDELMQDEEFRNLLDPEPEDEGIEMCLFDDIVFDIEPFDFNVEVEEYDW